MLLHNSETVLGGKGSTMKMERKKVYFRVCLRVLVQPRHTLFEWSHYSEYLVGEVCSECGHPTNCFAGRIVLFYLFYFILFHFHFIWSSSAILHIECSLVSICDYFLGCLLDSTDVLYVVLTPQKAPEKVVTDRSEGALYVQCGT